MSSLVPPFPEPLLNLLTKLQSLVLTSPTGLRIIDDLSTQSRALLASSAALALVLRLAFSVRKSKQLKKDARGGSGGYVDADVLGTAGETDAHGNLLQYDVIVVGGGTSGCTLAARLSEDPNIKVLVLEAGGSGKALSLSRMPAGFGGLFWTEHVRQLRTEPQVAAKGKQKFWPRAKMLGGCSSINAQMAQYGAAGDFDQWADYIKDDSWAWKNFCRYFTKFERYNPHPDYPLVDASVKGNSGPVDVGYFNTVTDASKLFIKACVGVGIPFTHDFNGTDGAMGVSRVLTYVDKRFRRVSAETAYFTHDVLERKNLTVAINATVTRIIFDTTSGSKPRAIGVEFAKKEGSNVYKAVAQKDVVLSGGAVHSPHILMLSGVGPVSQLKQFGIPVIKDHSGVGANLIDHPVVDVYFKDKLNVSRKFLKPKSLGDAMKLLSAILQYKLGKGGPLAMNFGESAAFIRSDDPILFPPEQYTEQLFDSTSAKDSPDLELFSTPYAYKEHGKISFDVHTYSLHCYLLRPTSHGHVLLKSANPFDQPSMNPNYITTREDLQKLIRGVRILLKIAQTEPLASVLDQDFIRSDLDHRTHLKSDAELEELVRDRVETVYHPTTTCRMAPEQEGGVVDSKLKVYGVDNLRVCDASIFPWIISGHTAGGCFAIAEKLSDDMKAEYGSR